MRTSGNKRGGDGSRETGVCRSTDCGRRRAERCRGRKRRGIVWCVMALVAFALLLSPCAASTSAPTLEPLSCGEEAGGSDSGEVTYYTTAPVEGDEYTAESGRVYIAWEVLEGRCFSSGFVDISVVHESSNLSHIVASGVRSSLNSTTNGAYYLVTKDWLFAGEGEGYEIRVTDSDASVASGTYIASSFALVQGEAANSNDPALGVIILVFIVFAPLCLIVSALVWYCGHYDDGKARRVRLKGSKTSEGGSGGDSKSPSRSAEESAWEIKRRQLNQYVRLQDALAAQQGQQHHYFHHHHPQHDGSIGEESEGLESVRSSSGKWVHNPVHQRVLRGSDRGPECERPEDQQQEQPQQRSFFAGPSHQRRQKNYQQYVRKLHQLQKMPHLQSPSPGAATFSSCSHSQASQQATPNHLYYAQPSPSGTASPNNAQLSSTSSVDSGFGPLTAGSRQQFMSTLEHHFPQPYLDSVPESMASTPDSGFGSHSIRSIGALVDFSSSPGQTYGSSYTIDGQDQLCSDGTTYIGGIRHTCSAVTLAGSGGTDSTKGSEPSYSGEQVDYDLGCDYNFGGDVV